MIPTKPKAADTPIYRDEQTKGIAAKQLLDNPAFAQATTALRDKLLHDWLHTAPDDVKGREWFHQQALAQQAFINNLTKLVQTGEMAVMSLAEMAPPPATQRKRK